MASTFTSVQFMSPPGGPGTLGAITAGTGITISADGVISTQAGGGTVTKVTAGTGLQGGGTGPEVILQLAVPTPTTIGGVRTVTGSGISIDAQGVIRSVAQFAVNPGVGIQVSNVTPVSSTVSALPAGEIAGLRGAVWVAGAFTDPNGLSLSASGQLSLTPATGTRLGGVKVGSGVSITPDGVLSATGTGGTITGVTAGAGLSGGGTAGTVTVTLAPPTGAAIGGVKAGSGITIAPDGTISTSSAGGTVTSVSATAPLSVTNPTTTPQISIAAATTSAPGVVQLSSALNDPGVTQAATTGAVAAAYTAAQQGITNAAAASTIASAALPKAGGTMTGNISMSGSGVGVVFSDASKIQAISDSVSLASSVTASSSAALKALGDSIALNYLPLSGGAMSGAITFTAGQSFPNVVPGVGGPFAYGSLMVGSGPGTYDVITPTADGQVLTSVSGKPTWVASAGGALPLSGGTMTGNIVFAGTQTFPGVVANSAYSASGTVLVGTGVGTYSALTPGTDGQVLTCTSGVPSWQTPGAGSFLPLSGGVMTGNITFNGGQTFPGTLPLSAFSAGGQLLLGTGAGTYTALPVGSNGQVLTVAAGAPSWSTPAASLPLAGGTMTGNITFNAGQTFPGTLPLSGGTMTGSISFSGAQTFPGTIPLSTLASTGDIIYASGASTAANLAIGAAGNLLTVVGGVPAWRSTTTLGLLTSAAAASTYAPLNSPTLTGPVIINAGGAPGSNAVTVSGGNMVLSSSYTPPGSNSTGSTGEISWDSNYLYICVSPNTWGRVAIDLTPF